jgi:hypothetical protein
MIGAAVLPPRGVVVVVVVVVDDGVGAGRLIHPGTPPAGVDAPRMLSPGVLDRLHQRAQPRGGFLEVLPLDVQRKQLVLRLVMQAHGFILAAPALQLRYHNHSHRGGQRA